jgi:hypothetical protein
VSDKQSGTCSRQRSEKVGTGSENLLLTVAYSLPAICLDRPTGTGNLLLTRH